jgi:hypothetical protein
MNKVILTTAIAAMMIFAASCGQNAQKVNNEGVSENTNPSENELSERITHDILALPEMQFANAAVEFVGVPSDEEPYFTVRGGSNMETHFATSFWFHVYVEPEYEIKIYDVIYDSEMTLEEWRDD